MSAHFLKLGRTTAGLLVTVLLVASLWGCGRNSPGVPASPEKPSNQQAESQTTAPPEPLFEDWSAPAATLMLSGEQHGFLEPCGCSEVRAGGLGRRADLVRQIQEKGWPVTALDIGGAVERNRRQSQIKFEMILAAMKDMNYQVLGLGPEELRFGPDYLLSQHTSPSSPDGSELSFLAANVVFYDSPELGTPGRTKIWKVGSLRLGVTAILGESYRQSAEWGTSNSAQTTIRPPNEVLPTMLERLKEANSDVQILLSHSRNVEESRRLARQFPEFDLVLSTGGPEDPPRQAERIGETMLVQVGHKGKYVGVVGIFPDDPENRLRFELVHLDKRRFQKAPQMHQHMRYYQQRLQDENIVENSLPIQHPRGGRFVGAKKCGECHTKAYAKWKNETRHHHAYHALIEGREGQQEKWISRIHDPECLSCHVTGWHPQKALRYETGFLSKEKTPHLVAQQCENCHGPGSRHVKLEQLWRTDREEVDRTELLASRKTMHLTTETAEEKVCYRCHDLDNSPNFDFDEYWEKVKHPWRD